MAGPPTLHTLGRLGSSDGVFDDQHQLVTLLAYLVHNGPTDRRTLATLFWPEAPAPLNSLSSALTRVRKLCPDAIRTDRHQVATDCTTDALDALAGAEQPEFVIYGGPFLAGFVLNKVGIELEEWIFDTREFIARSLATAAVSRCLAAADRGDHDMATKLAEQAVEIDDGCDAVLEHAGVLFEVLSAGDSLVAQRLVQVANRADVVLEAPTRPQRDEAGRSRELEQLTDELEPGRVVNLFGIGGVGKSWMTRRLDRHPRVRALFGDAVHYIELAGEVDGAVVRAELDARLDGILDRPTLVIIDDVRMTSSTVATLGDLVGVDNLAVVVLSRRRFEEPRLRTMSLRGLDVTDADGGAGPAVALFLAAADRVATQPRTDGFVASAIDICSQLAGVPLAVELTAAWLSIVPAEDILTILNDEEILDEAPPGEDLSLSHVIEQSWELLPDRAKEVLSGLSVIRGSFTRRSAREVAGVGVRDLAELHEHSLIDVGENGRLRCHSLVQSFAHRRLSEDPTRRVEIEQRHRAWFSSIIVEALNLDFGHIESELLVQLIDDRDNIEAAWLAHVEHRDRAEIDRCLPALDSFLLRSGQTHRARVMYLAALAAFPEHPDVMSNLAWVEMMIGNTDEADRLVVKALQGVPDDQTATRIALIRTQCALRANDGDVVAALDGYQTARVLVDEIDKPVLRALLDEDIGRAHAMLGEHDQAIVAFRETLDSARRFGDPHMEARSYLMLAVSQVPSDPEHALVLFDEGERIAIEHGLAHLCAYFPSDRAQAHLALDDAAAAASELHRAIELADQVGDHVLRVVAEIALARVLIKLGDPSASGQLTEALRLAIRSKVWAPALGAGIDVAVRVLDQNVGDDDAAALLQFALSHPHTAHADRMRASDAAITDESPTDLRLDEFCERISRLFRRIG